MMSDEKFSGVPLFLNSTESNYNNSVRKNDSSIELAAWKDDLFEIIQFDSSFNFEHGPLEGTFYPDCMYP